MKRDLCDLSAELAGVSRIITGLSNQLDNEKTASLSSDSMSEALYGLAGHLDRIVEDLDVICESSVLCGRKEGLTK